jgi:hypothetical protein
MSNTCSQRREEIANAPRVGCGQPPTRKQLAYLKSLAERTGQTFTWPTRRRQAGAQINRLKHARPSTGVEPQIEQANDRLVREAIEDSAAVRGFEVLGHGSNCRWSH